MGNVCFEFLKAETLDTPNQKANTLQLRKYGVRVYVYTTTVSWLQNRVFSYHHGDY